MGRDGGSTKRQSAGRGATKKDGRSVSAEITLLLNTLRELAAIRSTAEDAAGRILESAENLLAFADKEEAKKAEETILSIMTACGFHDLVGQRVTKIAKTLDQVIATRLKDSGADTKVIEAAARKPKAKLTLEGPAHPGSSNDQICIDALFKD
jgi:chemotaxis regulatin CheY-phosphate phosphatase CheZ